jgi:tetratricopeptide (TPR) repeat protein
LKRRCARLYPEATLSAILAFAAAAGLSREQQGQVAEIRVHGQREGCAVELDAAPAGKTNAQGELVLREVDPTDHYIHVLCPGQHELAYFVSPHAGGTAEIRVTLDAPGPPGGGSGDAALQAAESKIELRQLVKKAVELRAAGLFDEAVTKLHEATQRDPENSDLHRELGITFLLAKEWKRARVEMLEALKHDPDDADAHNGLGYALEKLGELEPALQEYRTATHLEPNDPSYREHYIEALAKLSAQKAEKKR